MAEQAEQDWLQKYFWLIAFVVLVLVAAGVVLLFSAVRDSYRKAEADLNRNYVELIDIRSGGSSRDLIYIDDVPRYDCSEEDGLLDCDDDPQPTREEPAG